MNSLYLDTNVFIYLSDKESPFYHDCLKLITYCHKNQIPLLTSTETIQEIIHLAKNTKQLEKGIKVAQKTLQLVSEILAITKTTIEIYLVNISKYPTATSRDVIHAAVCQENRIDKLISFDRDFKRFKELSTFTPLSILKKFNSI